MSRYSKTEAVGVNAVQKLVVDDLSWIFREQPIADFGIDAHLERVDDGNPTGKLIALQIKTGASHFHDTSESLIYYCDDSHLQYWTEHILPVLLVAHLPKSGETFWVHVDSSTVTKTKSKWKIIIPKKNIFGTRSETELSGLFEGTPAQQRLRKLSIDEPLMRHIVEGGKVSLELEDWVNKSLGRTPVKVFIHDDDGEEILSQDWFQYYVGYGIKELAEALFPWANPELDLEFYDEHTEFEEDFYSRLSRATDEDNGIYADADSTNAIYPYTESSGEVEYYRLQLTLNELGEAYLIIADHMING